jgi:hypothetical protein
VLGLPSIPRKERYALFTFLPLKIAYHELLEVTLAVSVIQVEGETREARR